MFFLLNRFFERHTHFKGDELRHLVGQCVWLVLNSRDVAHHGFCRHRSERNDLRHRIPAVGIGNVVNDFIAPVHAEVNVEVGHRDPLRVQKALKQQVVLNRIEVRNLECIGDERAGTRAPSRTYGNTIGFTPTDEVHNDQEVTGEAHLINDVEFKFQTVSVYRIILDIEQCKALV